INRLLPLALIVAMVCIMQTSAVASTFPSEEDRPDDASRDFAGVGAGSIVAGLTGSFPVGASPPRPAIVVGSGGRSQIASITAVALMVVLFLLAAGLMAYVPHAALSGILFYIAVKIFRLNEMIRIYQRGGPEILLVAASCGLVVALPIETGMLLAIVLSFVHSLYFVVRPYCLGRAPVPGAPGRWPAGPGREAERRAGAGRRRLCDGGAADIHKRPVPQRRDHARARCGARASETAGDRGQRHDRHRLYWLADLSADHRRAARALHRRRYRAALGPAGAGAGESKRADPHPRTRARLQNCRRSGAPAASGCEAGRCRQKRWRGRPCGGRFSAGSAMSFSLR